MGRLALAWAKPISGGIYASPIVFNGRVFLGGGDGSMHALDAASGTELWIGPQEPSFYVDSAAPSHGLVYANSLFQRLRAYDAATGTAVGSAPGWPTGAAASSTRPRAVDGIESSRCEPTTR